jgi:hypothetical protein
VFAFALSFAPFLKDLPDWLKLAILGGVFETSRRYLTSWYYALKSAMFITVVFDSNDSSFRKLSNTFDMKNIADLFMQNG